MLIGKKLSVIFLFLAVIPMILVGGIIFYDAERNLKKDILYRLEVVAAFNLNKLETFFRNLEDNVRISQDYYNVKTNLPVMARLSQERSNPDYLKAESMLDKQLGAWLKIKEEITDVMLIGTDGKIVYSANREHRKLDLDNELPDSQAWASREKSKEVTIGQIFRSTHKEYGYEFGLLVFAPVFDFQDKFAGLIVFEINLDRVYKFLQERTGLGESGEILLVKIISGDKVLILSPLRHAAESAFDKTIALGSNLAIPEQKAALGESGAGLTIDYRGEKVLSVWRGIPSLGWGLVAKIDAEEAFLVVHNLTRLVIFIFIITILVLMLVISAAANSIAAPIHNLHKGAEIIGRGNLDYRVGNKADDEIGQLSRAFDDMAVNLSKSTTSIDKLNNEITQREKISAELKRSSLLWQKTFDAIPDLIFIQDNDFTILKANKFFLDSFKLKSEEVVGKKCFEIVHHLPQPWPSCSFRKTRCDQQIHTEEVNDPGLGMALLITTCPLFDEQGNFFGSVHVAKDISEIKKYQDDLEKKNKELEKLDQLKTEFVSIVSHELRTPLSIIKEGISLVLDGVVGDINPKQNKILTTSKDNIDRLARIINSLLDISRIDSGRMELKNKIVDLRGLIENLVTSFTPLAKEKGLELRVSLPQKKSLNLYVDEDALIQIFNNLISNAFKFTTKGFICISLLEKEDEMEFTVSDTGIGIAAQNLPKVFNKFMQFGRTAGQGEKGTGLGLSIAKGLVELYGGRIWVESEEGRGSKFIFTIPKHSLNKIQEES